MGTEESKGTAVFALAGKVVNTGLVEVPMGTPLRQNFRFGFLATLIVDLTACSDQGPV
jgi:NADH:ubiquinone oxidoreductase subunit F (NADH-binding)